MTYSSRGGKVFFGLFLTFVRSRAIICGQAGVLELADEEDSKSFGLITRAGSTPATGTNKGATPAWGRALVATDCSRSTRRISRRLRRGIPSCRHPIRLPFLFCRAATAGSGACAASNPATCSCVHQCFVATPRGVAPLLIPIVRGRPAVFRGACAASTPATDSCVPQCIGATPYGVAPLLLLIAQGRPAVFRAASTLAD